MGQSLPSPKPVEGNRGPARAASRVPNDLDLVERVVETFVARYVRPKQRKSTACETERVLHKEIVGAWKGRRLSSVTRADVHELLDQIADRAPIMANRCLAALRKMCAWAVDREIIKVSPCAGLEAPADETSRDRVLVDDELEAVWQGAEAMGWPFGYIVRILILTGQRRGEVAGMRWQELDFDAKTWTLPKERCKNDIEHVVPLSSLAIEILESLPRISSKAGYVFTTSGQTPVSGFAKAKERTCPLFGRIVMDCRIYNLAICARSHMTKA
jgi:integrase